MPTVWEFETVVPTFWCSKRLSANCSSSLRDSLWQCFGNLDTVCVNYLVLGDSLCQFFVNLEVAWGNLLVIWKQYVPILICLNLEEV